MGFAKLPVPPVRWTITELALNDVVLMFWLKVTETVTCPLALTEATVLDGGLNALTVGDLVSTSRKAAAPSDWYSENGSVGWFEALPAWSTIRTRASV